jgi:quinol monooxygenase YgiN
MNQYVLIIHEVENYLTWQQVFDDAAAMRKAAGEISYQVLKYQLDSNRIVHFSEWRSIDDAKLFFESSQLVQLRIDAGVKSPDFIYLEQLASGVL